jgi:hypothetical protein
MDILGKLTPYTDTLTELATAAGEEPENLWKYLGWALTRGTVTPEEKPRPRGQRVALWSETDGMRGLETILRLKQEAADRKEAFHCIISGGDLGYYERDNLPGPYMLQQTMVQCLALGIPWSPDEFTLDCFSKHTGHQGHLLPAMLRVMGAKVVDLVIPLYHLPRFALTIGYGTKVAGINGLRFVPQPYGTWETRHAAKMPRREDDTYDPATQGYTYGELLCAKLPPFARENKASIAENTSEIEKIFSGMEHVVAASGKKLACYHLRLAEAIERFQIS